ncbi:APC membrane recruitment protein 1-like [Pyxicephalus adspersus]
METGSRCHEENSITFSSICTIQDDDHNDGECLRMDLHSTHSCMYQKIQGKQKKTPFKFFGGRKNIVTLPSFFGGKHKSLGKGNAKKSMSKNKTYDCISDVSGDDGKKGSSDNSVNRHYGHDLCKTGNIIPSSLSADSGITSPVKLDFNFHDISLMGSTECFEKKMNREESFFFPRPKKGFKGLFSSIRRRKKNKTPAPDKCERFDHITKTAILEKLNKYPSEDAELQCSSEQPKMKNQDSGVSSDCLPNPTVVCENEETQQGSLSMPNLTPLKKTEEFVVETIEGLCNDQNAVTDTELVCLADSSVPDVSSNVVNADLPNSAGDHLSLMFEEVSSVKSFDSLTGCGDDIAEQDIDNISDISLSLERSRQATKRSSCMVTYQGGGEEMATPDAIEEEYIQRLLEDSNEADASCELEEEKVHEGKSKGFTEQQSHAYSMGAEDSFIDSNSALLKTVLTPQSDQQESAPNSDEGYYDSTTPDPDDDNGEDGFSHKEHLLRDSYSGDALYEFYEHDVNRMSPAPGGGSLYERKTLSSEILDHFFDFNLSLNSGLSQDTEHKKGATETEEERLAVIQKQLFWDMQREAALKGLWHVNKDIFSKEKQIECETRTVNLMGRGKGCLTRKNILSQNVSYNVIDKEIHSAETRKQIWKDYQETPLTDRDYHRSYVNHTDGNCLVEIPGFELNVGSLKAQDQNGTKLATIAKLSNSSITPMHHVQNVFASEFPCLSTYNAENECEQTVDFADNDMLFSSISERLGSAGSISSFHHSLNSLPTMVNFDVVDVENEGECEQHVNLSLDEEVVSSFETFDHSYVKESLAQIHQAKSEGRSRIRIRDPKSEAVAQFSN